MNISFESFFLVWPLLTASACLLGILPIKDNINKQFLYIIIGIGLILFVVNLDRYAFPDFEEYQRYLKYADFGSGLMVEISFVLIKQVSEFLLGNSQFLFLIYLLLAVILKMEAIKQLSKFWFLSLAIYIASYWVLHDIIQIRQGVAAAFMLLSIKPLCDRDSKLFLLYCSLATFFHYSSVILFAFWFLSPYLKHTYLYLLLIPLSIALMLMRFDLLSLMELLPDGYLYSKIDGYRMTAEYGLKIDSMTKEEYIAKAFTLFKITRILFVYYMWYFIDNVMKRNRYALVLLKIYTIAISCMFLLWSVPVVAGRIYEYLLVVQIVLVPLSVYTLNKQISYLIPILYASACVFANWNLLCNFS